MKAYFSIILFLVTTLSAFAQSHDGTSCVSVIDSVTNTQVYEMVDQPPFPVGGMREFYQTLASRMKDSKTNDSANLSSKLVVGFVVLETGEITGQRILKNIEGTSWATQMLEVVSQTSWQPGKCSEIPVPTRVTLPLVVNLK